MNPPPFKCLSPLVTPPLLSEVGMIDDVFTDTLYLSASATTGASKLHGQGKKVDDRKEITKLNGQRK